MPTKRPAPLTVAELQRMNRNATSPTERRLLWEVSRLRKIVLQAYELDILLTDDRILSRYAQLVKGNSESRKSDEQAFMRLPSMKATPRLIDGISDGIVGISL